MKFELEKFKQSNVARIFLAYAVVAFGMMQIFDYLLPIIEAPLWVAQTLTLLLFLGFPISLLVGWVTQRPIISSETEAIADSISGYAHTLSRQKLILIGLGSSAIFGFLGFISMPYLLDQASFSSSLAEPVVSSRNNYRGFRASMNLGVTGYRAVHETSTDIALSQDGMSLAFLRHNGGNTQLYIKDLTDPTSESERLLGEVNNSGGSGLMFFSEDSNWLHFISGANLHRVRVEGGAFQTISDDFSVLRSGFTTFEDIVIFSNATDNILYSISGAGGDISPLPISLTDESRQVMSWPRIISDASRKLLFTSSDTTQSIGLGSIELFDFESGETTRLVETASNARYVESGHIIFVRDSALWAVPFDVQSSETTGEEVPVIQGIESNGLLGHATYSVSQTGRLMYLSGSDGADTGGLGQLVWLDKTGQTQTVEMEGRQFGHPQISPNGQFIAVTVYEPDGDHDIWVWDLNRKTLGRRTFEGKGSHSIWSTDSERLYYSFGAEGIRVVLFNGTEQPRALIITDEQAIPTSLSEQDGLVFTMGSPPEVFLLPMDQAENPEVVATKLGLAPASGWAMPGPEISPDGNWISYTSNESGVPQVYVRPFPNIDGGKWQVSIEPAAQAHWNPDGSAMYFWSADNKQLSTALTIGPEGDNGRPNLIEFGVPEEMFSRTGIRNFNTIPAWDYSPYNENFIFLEQLGGASAFDSVEAQTNLVVVENWFEELRSLAPVDIN